MGFGRWEGEGLLECEHGFACGGLQVFEDEDFIGMADLPSGLHQTALTMEMPSDQRESQPYLSVMVTGVLNSKS